MTAKGAPPTPPGKHPAGQDGDGGRRGRPHPEDQLAMGQRFRTAAANAVDVRTQREKGLSPERSRHHWWEHKADRFEKIYYTPAKKETE